LQERPCLEVALKAPIYLVSLDTTPDLP